MKVLIRLRVLVEVHSQVRLWVNLKYAYECIYVWTYKYTFKRTCEDVIKSTYLYF